MGQRQSQTPFSSAFWVQKVFRSKKVLSQKKISLEKMMGPKNFWVQIILDQKILSEKNLWSKALKVKKCWVKTNF